MRKIILVVFFLAKVFALDSQMAYKMASEFEKNGDFKQAMQWYKKAAKMSMESKDLNTSEYINDKVNSVKQTRSFYNEFFEKSQDVQTNETIEQILTGIFGLEPYHINYLLPVVYDSHKHENRKHFETEFQISFKKDVFSNLLGFDEKYAFGYTQTSWWQTFKDSKPFRETNYRPEVFVYGFYKDKNSFLKGYQLGLLHESNGRDREISRSWNRIYLTTFWQFKNLFISPRIWYRIPEREKQHINDENGDDNPDIHDYLGYGDLTLVYPWRKHLFEAKIRNNLKFNSNNKGSLDLRWTFPIWKRRLFGYINLFTGYGSSLEDYNINTNRVGLGFAFSR